MCGKGVFYFYLTVVLSLFDIFVYCYICMEPTILHEDEHIIAINKPAGLVVHAGVGTSSTLADWVIATYPSIRSVGEYADRPGMVHRLDKETSGVMLLAKHQEAFETLKQHFKKGKIQKEYHAFVFGVPKRSRGTITLSIGRSHGNFRKQTTHHTRGERREAYTEYVVTGACGGSVSFITFYPHTGRMHQIRVHAQSLQFPIVGDTLYAPSFGFALGFDRLALHARRISLHTHLQPKLLHIIAPYPDDFVSALQQCDIL